MNPSRPKRDERDSRPSRRSRSVSYDSEEEERRRRTRRKERELVHQERSRRGRREEAARDSREDSERIRRRSRSPAPESSRRRPKDRVSEHRSARDRSPRRESKGRGDGSSRGGTAQLSRQNNEPLPSQAAFFAGNGGSSTEMVLADRNEIEKQKPNLAPTGALAAASNSVAQADGTSIVLKYHEPPEARKPPTKDEWKLFVFKGSEILETIELSLRSCWLVGRELTVVDMAAEHPSISKQHAVIQFRYIEKTNEYGDKVGRVRPYLIDLNSANGTALNKDAVPSSRYLELRDKDMIEFGHSTREYVVMLSPKIKS